MANWGIAGPLEVLISFFVAVARRPAVVQGPAKLIVIISPVV